MSEDKYYLKQNVRLEPLFNQWYAWPHLISPATAAMNIANAHVKIMKSFVSAPDVHAAAVRNPMMRGGPFIDLPSSRVGQVKDLLQKTVREQASMLDFADAVKKLDELLEKEALGQSLEPLYERVPQALRGYVELVYDLNRHPSIRFIEGLLYNSRYYDDSLQSIDLSTVNEDYRPFVFSTPRFEDTDHLQIKQPLKSEAVDELFAMRSEPQSYGYIKEALGITDDRDQLLRSFLTSEAPAKSEPFNGEGVRVRYYGHACLLIESKDVSILIDPLISYSYQSDVVRFTYADLPETIDYVLITHTHQDHCLFEHLLQIRRRIKNVIVPRNGGGALEDPSLKLILQKLKFKNVVEIDEMEEMPIEGGSIMALPFFGEHGDLNIRTKAAHFIRLKGVSILCAADSNNIETQLYEHLHNLVGDLDVIFIGMECDGAPISWIYGQLFTKPLERRLDQTRRLSGSDCLRGLDMLRRLNCRQAYVYAMGQEPWLTFVTSIKYTEQSKPIVESDKLVEECKKLGIVSERLFGRKELFFSA